MRGTRFFLSLVPLALVGLLTACGGPVSNQQLGTGSAVTLTMRDDPPAGVTVLSFEITVTGAVLQPGNASLVSHPIEVEVEKLQTESALLNTATVPSGNYSSIDVTFANPRLTIKNDSGAAIGSCANGAVCELTPPLDTAKVSYSGPPFPLNLTMGMPIGLLLDFDLTKSIQTDLSINPTITFTQLPAMQGTGEMDEIDDVHGQVTGVDTTQNEFTLQTSNGMTLTIKVDSNTQFEGFESAGLTNSFASIATGQNLEVELNLMSGGTLVAKQVELAGMNNEEGLEGTVVSVDSPTQFRIVVFDEMPDIMGVGMGAVVTVTIQSGAQFLVDSNGLTLPSDVVFTSSSGLMVGQEVEIRRLSGSSGSAAMTDHVTLKMSQITAKVESTNPPNFLVNNLSTLFTTATPPVTEINVLTSSQTEFEDVSGVAALNMGDTVSLRGLLFKTTGIPELVAGKVRKR